MQPGISIAPSGHRTFIVTGMSTGLFELIIRDLYGPVVYSTHGEGRDQLIISLPASVASGIYLFSLRQRDNIIHQRVFIE